MPQPTSHTTTSEMPEEKARREIDTLFSKIGLRNCQYEAVKALGDSFRTVFHRVLIALATGAGKTYLERE